MKWLIKVLILFFILPLFGIIPILLLGVEETLQTPLALGWLFIFIATVWLVIRGKRNRFTMGIPIAIALALLTTCVSINHATQKRNEENCVYSKTHCAKLDGQAGLFHCGTTIGSTTVGGIMIMDVEEKCMPTKEQSCTYAKQFCALISTKDSVTTHYKCDHETITCP